MKNEICTKKIKCKNKTIDINAKVLNESSINSEILSKVEIDLDTLKDILFHNIKLLEYQVENDYLKSIILYQMIFCFELYLKYNMVLLSIVGNFSELKKYGHSIDNMVFKLESKTSNGKFGYIKNSIKKIKLAGNKQMDLKTYPNFKYGFNEERMLFYKDCRLNSKEKNIVKDVIECFKKQT